MERERATGKDRVRQLLNLVGAVGQVVVGYTVDVGAISDGFRNPIVPAGFAFAIWGLIFLLLGVYAVAQALPNQTTNYLYRQIGWWTGLAMLGDTVWTLLFGGRLWIVAQAVIFLIALCAIRALVTWADVLAVRPASLFERWVVGPAVGLLAGWITAASFVGLAATLIALGWANDGVGAFVGGSGLLLFGGGVAAWTLARASGGPATGWVPYGLAVVWALGWIVAAQVDRSLLVAAVAVAIAVVVVALLALAAREQRRATTAPAALGA
jgi:hypothetical protein